MFLNWAKNAPFSEGYYMYRAAESQAACMMIVSNSPYGLLATPDLPFHLPGIIPRFKLSQLPGDWAFYSPLIHSEVKAISFDVSVGGKV